MKHALFNGLFLLLLLSGQASAAELATGSAQLLELPRVYRLDGVVEAVNRTTVSAQTSGQVQEILFDVDDYVEKGQVLALLKDTEHQAGVIRAAADLKEAVGRLEEARDEHKRTSDVYARKLVSEAEMDRAKAALTSALARFEAAKAGVIQAKEQLEYTQVRAPYTGVVTERHMQVGEIAQPGQKLISGLALDRLRVVVDVPQSLITGIRNFGSARVELPDGSQVDAAELTIFPFADRGSNTFKVRIELPANSRGLFPGMFVKSAFVTGHKQVLIVPESTVVYRSEVTGVYVVGEDGRVQFRHVRLGARVPQGISVLSGVEQGERLALDPVAAAVELKRQRAERDHG